jgi:putative endopeptidase
MRRAAYLFFLLATATLFTACGSDGGTTPTDNSEPHTVDLSFMDTTVSPRDDFFSFANGAWVANNEVPSTESAWGSFNELSERNNALLQEILNSAAENGGDKGSIDQLIGDYYYTLMDSTKRDADGVTPLQPELDKIASMTSKDELAPLVAEHHLQGIHPLFNMGIEQDLGDNTRTIAYIGQGGTGLPSKDFYEREDYAEIRAAYVEHITQIFILAGHEEADAKEEAGMCMKIETSLAAASMGPIEMRDISTQYNKRSVAEFKAMVPSFNWDIYFADMGVSDMDTLVVTQLAFFQNLEGLLNSTSDDELRTYLTWQLLDQVANALSSDFEKQNFSFYGTVMSGRKEMKPRWKRAISAMQGSALGEAVGHAFVDIAFSSESKDRVDVMVDNLMAVFAERLEEANWLSASTKEQAKNKLASFTRKLGYPENWTDYSAIEITRESYVQNYLSSRRFSVCKELNKLGQPIDKTEWGMPPHMINAYYNPLYNEIVFPAGIMQPPFFDPEAEDAINYGRMGMIIGHEFSHGFDDQGSQFDATGLYSNWWTPEDFEEFGKRTGKLVDQFNGFEALPGLFVKGDLTLGENIADLAGLTLSYYAYQKSLEGKEREVIQGYTNEQRYFIGFAQIWKINYTDEAMRQQVETNPHSPGMFRVIGPLQNMPEFWEAFDVQEGDYMRLPAEKITKLW